MKLVITDKTLKMSETHVVVTSIDCEYDITISGDTSLNNMSDNLMKLKSFNCALITADERPLLLIPELFEIDDVYIYRNGVVKSIRECTTRQLKNGHDIFKLYLAGEFEF